MRRSSIAAPALALSVLLIASCSATAGPSAAEVSASHSQMPQTAAVAKDSPKPTPSPTPAPVPTASPTPPVMATPGPAVKYLPKSAALSDDDYFIIDRNWADSDWAFCCETDAEPQGYCYGLVDARGKVILPFQYLSLNSLLLHANKNKTGKKYHFFYAEEIADAEGSTTTGSGCLYKTDGKKACDERYYWAEAYCGYRIAAERADTKLCGVMTPEFEEVVPFQYSDMVCFDDWIAAEFVQDGQYRLDFYDSKCELKGSLDIGKGGIFRMYSGLSSEDFLAAEGTNGKLGFIDKSLTWCAEPQWDKYLENINEDTYYGPGYEMVKGGRHYHVNKYGKAFVPKGIDPQYCYQECDYGPEYSPVMLNGHFIYSYDSSNDSESGIHRYVIFNDEGKTLYSTDYAELYLYDGIIVDDNKAVKISDGKVLYQSRYGSLDYTDGILIDGGRAVDFSGKELLPGVTDVLYWDKASGLYGCGRDGCIGAFFTKDGKKLPLPAGYDYECVSKDRFIATTYSGLFGICNAEGQWLLPPRSGYLDSETWPFFNMDGNDDYGGSAQKYGLVDSNGRVIYDAVFNETRVLSGKRGLYEVIYGGIHGVVDTNGNWIWYCNPYDDLQD
jgi:hypothetical protein